MQTNPDKAKK